MEIKKLHKMSTQHNFQKKELKTIFLLDHVGKTFTYYHYLKSE